MSNPNNCTGPKTPEGKRRSSMNALKHGIYATSAEAAQKTMDKFGVGYLGYVEDMMNHYRPADPVEFQLVLRIARCVWRLKLSEQMERRVLERTDGPARASSSYDRVLKYERLVDIHLHRAIDALAKKRRSEKQV